MVSTTRVTSGSAGLTPEKNFRHPKPVMTSPRLIRSGDTVFCEQFRGPRHGA
jgi:hypothetical protein